MTTAPIPPRKPVETQCPHSARARPRRGETPLPVSVPTTEKPSPSRLRLNTSAPKLNTFPAKVNTSAAKMKTFAFKLNTCSSGLGPDTRGATVRFPTDRAPRVAVPRPPRACSEPVEARPELAEGGISPPRGRLNPGSARRQELDTCPVNVDTSLAKLDTFALKVDTCSQKLDTLARPSGHIRRRTEHPPSALRLVIPKSAEESHLSSAPHPRPTKPFMVGCPEPPKSLSEEAGSPPLCHGPLSHLRFPSDLLPTLPLPFVSTRCTIDLPPISPFPESPCPPSCPVSHPATALPRPSPPTPRHAHAPTSPAPPLPPPPPPRIANLPEKSAKNCLSPARPHRGRAGERQFPLSSPRMSRPPHAENASAARRR